MPSTTVVHLPVTEGSGVPCRVSPTVAVHLGASVGANSHPLLHVHIAAALDAGLSPVQVEAALKMAEYVQQRAAEITADKATHTLEELGAVAEGAAARS